jgi:hypothetical protein
MNRRQDAHGCAGEPHTTVIELLACFQQGGGRPSPASICALAQVGPAMRWADLNLRELSRVAWALTGMR